MIRKAIAKGAILSYITIIVNMVLTFFYTPWMIEKLGTSDYGLYSLTLSFISYFLLDFGFSRAVQRYVAKYRASGDEKKISKLMGIISKIYLLFDIILFLCLSIVYFLLTDIFSGLTAEELETLKKLYCIAGILSVMNFIFKPLSGILKAYEYFVEVKSLEMFQKLGTIAVLFIVLLFGGDVYALIFVNGFISLLTSIFQFLLLKRKSKIGIDWSVNDRDLMKSLFIFSVWSFFLSLAVRFRLNFMPVILGITADTTEISLFGISRTIEESIFTFTSALSGLFLPTVSRLLKQRKDSAVMLLMVRVGRIQLFIITLIVSSFIVFGDSFIELWIGKDFSDVYSILLFMVLPYLISLTQTIATDAILIENRIKYEALAVFFTSLLSFGLAIPLSMWYGAKGCAIAIFIGIVIDLFIMNRYYYRKMKISIGFFFKECHLKILPILTVYIVLSYFIKHYFPTDTWITLSIGLILYIAVYCLIVCGVLLNAEERRMMRQVFRWMH